LLNVIGQLFARVLGSIMQHMAVAVGFEEVLLLGF
jgi:hypothetical protein